MTLDEGKIDQAVLALLYLGLHDGARAWKGFDWEAMNRLYDKGFISDPRGKTKSVVFTEEGLDEARRLLEQLFGRTLRGSTRMWIMVAGPYRSGSSDPAVWAANLRMLNQSANAIFQKGHVPIIGVNMALPLIEVVGQESYERIMTPLSLSLTERCDAVLRVAGVSKGADEEVDRFRARGLRVFSSIEEIPSVLPDAG
jgi:Domain of unknown function (DUF6429)